MPADPDYGRHHRLLTPLIIGKEQIGEIVSVLGEGLNRAA